MKLRWLKFAAFLIVVGGAALLAHGSGVFVDFDHSQVQQRLDALGSWGPLGFILMYAALIVASSPGTIITVLGATMFPLWEALAYVMAGALLGATISFGIGRTLGREAVQSVIERSTHPALVRVGKWSERLEANGLVAVAYLRIAYVPFALLNYAASLTAIRFRDFLVGTFLGIVPGTFVFVFMGNTIRRAWTSGSWGALWGWQLAVAIALFAASLALPMLLQRRVEPPVDQPARQ